MRSQLSKKNLPKGREQAIVIGSSIAGMLAARVLSDHFTFVTILERDPASTDIVHRRGVPQSHHLHALLARGLEIIEELFPGIRAEMLAAGGHSLDTGADVAWHTPAGWGKHFKSNLSILSFSRPFLDWHVRKRLATIPNISFISTCEVTRLTTDQSRNTVNGVSIKLGNVERDDTDPRHAENMIKADLVVDASGRHSRAPQWLNAIGYDAPRETIVNAFLGYATRLYERPPMHNKDWKAVFLQAAPPEQTRAGILFPIENNRFILTLCGGDRDYPPSDEREFLKFVESLPSTLISEIIQNARPLSPIRSFHNTQNRMRHYEKLSRQPGNFVLLGDSVCAFNPVYGQGMTVAAMSSIELRRAIAAWRHESFGLDFVRSFQKRLAKVNTLPWALATGEDCRYRGTTGASRGWKLRLMHEYVDQIIALTTRDIVVRSLWLRVFQMLEPPSKLFQPKIMVKVLREMLLPQPKPRTATRFVVRQPSWANTSQD